MPSRRIENIKKLMEQARLEKGFEVTRDNGVKHGPTRFYDMKDKTEAVYMYVEDRFDFLSSTGIEPGSLSFDRLKGCQKANKKLKDKSELKLARFFSMEKGFYSIEVLYKELFENMDTSLDRLESIERKLLNKNPGFIKRWCNSNLCACMGCANSMLSWQQNEHKDYMIYLRAKEFGINPRSLKD